MYVSKCLISSEQVDYLFGIGYWNNDEEPNRADRIYFKVC